MKTLDSRGNVMKDYYQIIVELSTRKCAKDDYGNKQKVRDHNIMMCLGVHEQ